MEIAPFGKWPDLEGPGDVIVRLINFLKFFISTCLEAMKLKSSSCQ
ncbi:hypothetical protein SDJN02_11153, partial [Cucurbita argyrosperma subsp. argyrosperma]